jgi:hypothetical protein
VAIASRLKDSAARFVEAGALTARITRSDARAPALSAAGRNRRRN